MCFNFNGLLAIKTVTGEKYSKTKTLNDDILNILLEQEEDNGREIEIEEKTSDEFDLKYRTIPFQKLQRNSREVRPSTSATAL